MDCRRGSRSDRAGLHRKRLRTGGDKQEGNRASGLRPGPSSTKTGRFRVKGCSGSDPRACPNGKTVEDTGFLPWGPHAGKAAFDLSKPRPRVRHDPRVPHALHQPRQQGFRGAAVALPALWQPHHERPATHGIAAEPDVVGRRRRASKLLASPRGRRFTLTMGSFSLRRAPFSPPRPGRIRLRWRSRWGNAPCWPTGSAVEVCGRHWGTAREPCE